jgi:hypothetical protein
MIPGSRVDSLTWWQQEDKEVPGKKSLAFSFLKSLLKTNISTPSNPTARSIFPYMKRLTGVGGA